MNKLEKLEYELDRIERQMNLTMKGIVIFGIFALGMIAGVALMDFGANIP